MAGAHAARLTRWLVAVLLLAGLQAAWAQEQVAFAGGWLRFATLEEARAELARADEWTATAGDFQRAVTVGASSAPDDAAFRAALAQAALAWHPVQVERWRQAASSIAPAIASLGVKLPETVLLVSTNGSESGNAPYTRGRAVFLPLRFRAPIADGELLAHELFHVLTRHDPALADRVYALFGFERSAPLEWPAQWAEARISNPDAPHHRHLMWLEGGGQRLAVMPVLVARRTELMRGETLFNVLDVRLLAVEPGADGQPTRALLRDGQPVWHHAQASTAFLRRLGGNTGYVFHPEETAADNFAFLVSGRTVRNPELIAQLRAVLAGQPAPTPSTSR